MKRKYIILPLLFLCTAVAAQENNNNRDRQKNDSDDFFVQLHEVTVTGVIGDTKRKNVSTPVSIITPQTLRSSASTNVIDAIALQPGVSQLTTGGGISKPIIRGLGYNRVVVLSEGIRQEGQQWGAEHGVEVAEDAVNHVEIIKGPASLMYGSDAMAGVVILHAPPILPDGVIKGNFSTEYHTNNGLFSNRLSFSGNRNGFVWDARLSDKMAHAYKNKRDGYVPGSQFGEQAGRLLLGLNRNWGHSHLVFTAYHLLPSIVEGERDTLTGELVSVSENVNTYDKTLPFQHVRHYKLVWDHSQNIDVGYLKAIIGYQQNQRQEFEESADEYGLFLRMHTLTYNLRFLTNEWKGWKFSTGVGGMWQQSGNEGEECLIPDYQLFDAGLFASASKSLKKFWQISGGIRYDYRWLHGFSYMEDGVERFKDFNRNFNGLTGSLGSVWNLGKHWDVRVNVARGFRTPNMSELASNGIHEGTVRYEIGNRDLKAEYSLQADLGVDYNTRFISAQLSLFANHIDNYIFTRLQPGEIVAGYPTYIYTQGDARLMGFEAGVDFHPIHAICFNNTISYTDAQLLNQSENSKYLPFTPAPRWISELRWEPLKCQAFNLFYLKHLAAGMEYNFEQNHIYSAYQTETSTPSYTLLNLSAGAEIMLKEKKIAEIYVIANNLLDCVYQSHLSRLKYSDVNVVTGHRGVCNMGRNITFKLVIPIEADASK